MGSRLVLNLREAYYRHPNAASGRVSLATTFNQNHSVLQSVCFVEAVDHPGLPPGLYSYDTQTQEAREDLDEEEEDQSQSSDIRLRTFDISSEEDTHHGV